MKIALVGIGKIALDQHVPAIAASPDWDLAATVSRNGTVPGVEAHTDFAAFLAARPDVPVVSLTMPPVPRFAYAEAALNAGRHVMLEKPPGATLSEVHALQALAADRGLTLFATWHSRMAYAVAPAKAWLRDKTVLRAHITWREDVRRWHPGQTWVFEPGGMGVFDPGINALSILTAILPAPVHLTAATLTYPENCQTPIAAALTFSGQVTADFDWRQEGPQTWDIDVAHRSGPPRAAHGRQPAGDRRRRDGWRKLDHGRIPGALRPHGRTGRQGAKRCRPRPGHPCRGCLLAWSPCRGCALPSLISSVHKYPTGGPGVQNPRLPAKETDMLTGKHLIAGQWVAGETMFTSSPASGEARTLFGRHPGPCRCRSPCRRSGLPELFRAQPRRPRHLPGTHRRRDRGAGGRDHRHRHLGNRPAHGPARG